MFKKFSKVKFGQAIKEYDEEDGIRYYVRLDDGAVCAFDWADNFLKCVYDFWDDDDLVEVVPIEEAMEWVQQTIDEICG